VKGGRILPLQNVVPRCQTIIAPVGIGNDMNQAGFFNTRLYLIAILQQGLPSFIISLHPDEEDAAASSSFPSIHIIH